ncbi:hypothetical protein [Pseudofulvibacter geojedonensis]|uniref:Uncharacterized protein n=1 Tax=Pseudofulvibacter geojedonensis TaxID=1123758 RepID=A0ABW3I4C4_9FLAO
MTKQEHIYFEKLKEAITEVFNSNNGSSFKIQEWKGSMITSFQEDLFQKTKGKVSEKWFYTYCKNTPEKLPRIDILNLLSIYSNYNNWEDFKTKNTKPQKNKAHKKVLLIGLTVLISLVLSAYFYNKENHYHFCFIDEDTNEPIVNTKINLEILINNEPSIYKTTDSLGCFSYETKENKLIIVASSPFYFSDTIHKSNKRSIKDVIKLKTDDYALMLNYYTNGNIKDWQKRKRELENLIDSKAKIYQVFKNSIGIEIYTKEDFINKLLIPTSSLKNIQILKKEYKNNKIVTLKFMTK